MLRLLGFVFLLLICVGTAPWGLVVGAIFCVAWLFQTPAGLTRFWDADIFQKSSRVVGADHRALTAVPLVNAVYCANCDAITDSPHEACRSCGSHSILAVSRLWHQAVAPPPAGAARYKIHFTAEIRDIPAIGLNQAINLITRLADLGGNLGVFHIQVDDVETSNVPAEVTKIELVKRPPRPAHAPHRRHRKAS